MNREGSSYVENEILEEEEEQRYEIMLIKMLLRVKKMQYKIRSQRESIVKLLLHRLKGLNSFIPKRDHNSRLLNTQI